MLEALINIINGLMVDVIPEFRFLYNAGLFIILVFIGTAVLARDRKGKASLFIAAAAYGFAFNVGNESVLYLSNKSTILGIGVGFYYFLGNLIRGVTPYLLGAYAIYLFVSKRENNIKFYHVIDAIFAEETDLAERLKVAERATLVAEDNADTLKTFLRIISHELKTPTTTMANYADLCVLFLDKVDIDTTDKDTLLKYLQRILSSAETSMEVIGGLVDYNLSISHKNGEPFKKADLNEHMTSAIEATDLDKAALITFRDGTLPTVWGGDSIKRIFVNIFSNAIRYRHPDRPLKVHIGWEVTRSDCIIKIQDNGLGFPPERASLIFDMFKSAHKDNQKGSGMGMAISRGIARRYRGDIWAESEGKGATFYVRLPLRG
jgi:signal transduction histidine kinase